MYRSSSVRGILASVDRSSSRPSAGAPGRTNAANFSSDDARGRKVPLLQNKQSAKFL